MTLIDFAQSLEGITPTRNFNLLYIILDSIFILVLLGLLIYQKKYVTLIWSLIGGVLYYLVDYGYFYLISGSRVVTVGGVSSEAYTALVLLWMSLSYGITNFVFIWLCLKKDKYLKEYLILIIGWWLVAPSISSFGGPNDIQTFRTTNQYHGAMAIILVVGYLGLIVYNIVNKKKVVNILALNLVGISVQFCWEFALLVNQIRPMNENSIMTLLVNSIIETNLGLPYMYLIYIAVSKRFKDDLSKQDNFIDYYSKDKIVEEAKAN